MSFINLKIAADANAWRLFSSRRLDERFSKVKNNILEKFDYTCQYCGFRSKKYQEIVNIDGDYRNNKTSNLTVACPFCVQCMFLNVVGKGEEGGGTMIYFPEMSQNELNAVCHVLFCAIDHESSYQKYAQNIYRTMSLRSKIIEKVVGEKMSDPAIFANSLMNLGKKIDVTNSHYQGIRLLPSREKFLNQISFWNTETNIELKEEYT